MNKSRVSSRFSRLVLGGVMVAGVIGVLPHAAGATTNVYVGATGGTFRCTPTVSYSPSAHEVSHNAVCTTVNGGSLYPRSGDLWSRVAIYDFSEGYWHYGEWKAANVPATDFNGTTKLYPQVYVQYAARTTTGWSYSGEYVKICSAYVTSC